MDLNCIRCGKILRAKQKYCSNKCQKEHAHEQYIEKWKNGEYDGSMGTYQVSKHVRRYLFEKYNNRCCKCGWRKKNPKSGKIPLQINHISGNSFDHAEENLELLCPNCHSLTETFMALNKGNGSKEKQNYFRRYYNKTIIIIKCEQCGKEFEIAGYQNGKQMYCSHECASLASRKVIRPTKDELKKLIEETSFVSIGKLFGVSDNAVRKWAKIYNLI